MKILDRTKLINDYEAILAQNHIIKNGSNFKIQNPNKIIITQSTSGSRNTPLLIPRYHSDIKDIISRLLRYYELNFNCNPQKIAMLGGISHIMAASSLKIDNIEIKHYNIDEIEGIIKWQPEMISCYPSVLREIIAKFTPSLKFLKAIKVGGEKLFPADCENIFKIFPNLVIIEQYGSTELPALAFRGITSKNFKYDNTTISVPFELQNQRFTYLTTNQKGWHPFIAKDNFSDLLFNMNAYYDTGDEAFWFDSKVLDFRRNDYIESTYFLSINELLQKGFINIQLNLDNKTILTENNPSNCTSYKINGVDFLIRIGKINRIESSNKLPLIIDGKKISPISK